MKPLALSRTTYSNPWLARIRLKDIIKVIVWARENNIKVCRLHRVHIHEALRGRIPADSRPRLKIYNSGLDEE